MRRSRTNQRRYREARNGRGRPSNGRKDLIRLDTVRIRKKALADYRKAEKTLGQLKEDLKRYHEQDQPGFRSWVHQQFGALLTRQRELSQEYAQLSSLAFEIQQLQDRDGLSEVDAYRKVLWRRDHPKEAEEEDRQRQEEDRKRFGEDAAEDDDDDGEFDWDAEWERQEQEDEGETFDEVPEEAWEDFSHAYEHMTGHRPPPRRGKEDTADGRSAKDLYRTIVRRLHPDHHGEMTEARKALWHEAQEAYRRRDAMALYNILARCDNGEAGLGAHSPVGLIRRLTEQLKRACRAARGEMGRMRRDPAWDYNSRVKDPRFVSQVKREIESACRQIQDDLREFKDALEHLKWLAAQPDRPPSKLRRRARSRYQDIPEDLFF